LLAGPEGCSSGADEGVERGNSDGILPFRREKQNRKREAVEGKEIEKKGFACESWTRKEHAGRTDGDSPVARLVLEACVAHK